MQLHSLQSATASPDYE